MTYQNIGILAHVDAGKTTLTEQILYKSGVVRAAGSVDSGTTATDSMDIERQRGISVRAATASCIWDGATVNIIDTPGHVDFAGEVERSLAALDWAILLISAVEGVRAHTENILRALERATLPCLVFINKIDRAGTDVDRVLSELAAVTARTPVLFSAVCDAGEDRAAVLPMTEDDFRARVTEGLCELNEEAEEAFLSDDLLPADAACALLKTNIAQCGVIPVLCGCAKTGIGVTELLDFAHAYMPVAGDGVTDHPLSGVTDHPLSGVIFKIEHDKTVGKIAHVRLYSGSVDTRDEVEILPPPKHGTAKADEGIADDAVAVEEEAHPRGKVTQIRRFTGGKYADAGTVGSGDIAALCGLTDAKAGHFIGSIPALLATSDTYRLAQPYLRVRVSPADANADGEAITRLAAALAQLSDEEPYMDAKWENGQRDIVINTTGTIQLEVVDSLLQSRYGIRAQFSPPTVIYKETPAREGFAYADYTMPKPCWAVVKFRFEPMPRGYGVSYHGKLPSNQCFYRYQSHIRKSFYDSLKQGLYGWEVTDFRCTLVDGQHHTIHTHPLDFFVCTPMAVMNGLASMGVTLLEPMLDMRITCPMELSGKVITEISRMGGEYEAPVLRGDSATMAALVPAATSMDFPVRLASMSGGRAILSTAFSGYRENRDGNIYENPRIGVNPLDRSKWILWARGAYTLSEK